jgi:hypothetical protein
VFRWSLLHNQPVLGDVLLVFCGGKSIFGFMARFELSSLKLLAQREMMILSFN